MNESRESKLAPMALPSEMRPIVRQADGGAWEEFPLSATGTSLLGMGEISLLAMLPVVAVAVLAGVWIGRHQGSRRPARLRHLPPQEDFAAGERELSSLPLRESWEMSETRFCPICFGEYVSGTLVCEDCGVDLVEEMEMPDNDPPIEEGLVCIGHIPGFLRSQMIRQYLSANRIPSSSTRSMFGDAMGCDLYVFESDALRAKRLIQQYLTEFEDTAV